MYFLLILQCSVHAACIFFPPSLPSALTFPPSRWRISQPARHDQSSPDADWAIKVSNDRPLSVMSPAPVVKQCIKLLPPPAFARPLTSRLKISARG